MKPTAYLEWSLNVDCPHCSESIDLADYDRDENMVAHRIFNNEWNKLEGYEVTCPHCDELFELEKVEY